MPRIIVLGGGVCGLAASLLLARDGHEVTVLERDPAPVPETLDDAWSAWERGGVAQFHQPHYLQPVGGAVLDEALPDVRDALVAAGAPTFNALSIMPPTITDRAPRPGDERFATITARRPTLEWAFARAAAIEPGVDVRRGVTVDALETTSYDGTPHVTGVRTVAGETVTGDLVVDAMGRRSQLPRLLADAGARPVHEETEDSGFIYYTRYFRARDGGAPPAYRAAPLVPMPSFSILSLPGDNRTWSVTLYISSGDRALKAMRHERAWDAVLAACPRHAHWADGEPLTGVLPMGGIVDRRRRMVVDGRPVATGIVALADAWACTNPSLGRGMTLALLHARHLRDFVRYHLESPRELAEVWDTVTEAELTPWYRSTVREDRARLRQLEARRDGLSPPPPPDPESALCAALFAAAMHDPDVFRALIETRVCLATPEEVVARPAMADRILELAARGVTMPPGPDRAQLLALLAA
jgi:2-polyprenyl-6-methoxyphenol hydroxylase-like FAD-dependent oxidoreductase